MNTNIFEKDFNLQQQKAIKADINEHHLVLAGAGSGKTKVLIARLTYLLKRGILDCSDYNIMVVTFTRKASDELKERTYNYLGYMPYYLWSGTFHHICLKMLKENFEKAHLNKNFQILDETEQKEYIRKIIFEFFQYDKDKCNVDKCYEFIQKYKSNGIRYQSIIKNKENELFIDIYKEYDLLCQRENKIDFNELLLRTTIMLEKYPDIRQHYQNRFKHILIDEFQDIDNLEYRWLKLLIGKDTKIFAVGDDDQSIYSFKGANVDNIIDFKNTFAKKNIIYLEQNYRSTSNILNAANDLIKNNDKRLGKNIWSENDKGEKIEIFKAKTVKSEAKWVINKIKSILRNDEKNIKNLIKQEIENFKELNKKEKKENVALTSYNTEDIENRINKNKIQFNDFAILFRNNNYSKNVEHYLLKENLPYKLYGSNIRFFDREEIKDVLAYIKLILNLQDSISLNRIINKPNREIGLQTLKKLNIQAIQNRQSLFDYCLTFLKENKNTTDKSNLKIFEKLKNFFQLLQKLVQPNIKLYNLKDYYDYILEETGLYKYYLEKDEKNKLKKEKITNHAKNLNLLGEIIEEYNEKTKPVQYEFLNIKKLNENINLSENKLIINKNANINNISNLVKDYIKNNENKNISNIDDIMMENQNEIFETKFEKIENYQEYILKFILKNDENFSNIRNRLNKFLNNCYFNEEQAQNNNTINLLTAHASKGLEFKYVFIIGLEQGIFPNFISTKLINNKKYIQCNIQEERRLMYVAMTRAKNQLFISYPKQNTNYIDNEKKSISFYKKNIFYTTPSTFLNEIPQELIIIDDEK